MKNLVSSLCKRTYGIIKVPRLAPSDVATQSFDNVRNEISLPKCLHTICKQVMPHIILYTVRLNYTLEAIFHIKAFYNLDFSSLPAPVPLYLPFPVLLKL